MMCNNPEIDLVNINAWLYNYTGREQLSCVMRKPTFCICENKDADKLCSNREADQRLFFSLHR